MHLHTNQIQAVTQYTLA